MDHQPIAPSACVHNAQSSLTHNWACNASAVAVQQRLVAHAATARPLDEWHKRFSRLRRPVDGSGTAAEVLEVAADAAQVRGWLCVCLPLYIGISCTVWPCRLH